jgi:glycosyltransferase involved in cell wall biosynthesis
MTLVYLQSYPIYHDLISADGWIALENRDKWMPAITAEYGHEVEIWGVSDHDRVVTYPWKEGVTVTIRLFKADHTPAKSKHHWSSGLLAYAKQHPADYYVIKGVDGGAGVHLIDTHIKPEGRPFAFVIGGKCTSPYFHLAHTIFYESEVQIPEIEAPYWTLSGRKRSRAHLIKLPKSVDTERFRPLPDIEKVNDLISAGRLISYYKNYDDMFTMSSELRVAFIGGGPLFEEDKARWPHVTWYGSVPNTEVASYLNTSKAFFYPSKRDYFPRAIVEAAACGLPVLCFDDHVGADVVPETIGIRLHKSTYKEAILDLFRNPARLAELGHNARKYALANYGGESSRGAVEALLRLLK